MDTRQIAVVYLIVFLAVVCTSILVLTVPAQDSSVYLLRADYVISQGVDFCRACP